ncbi:MAG: acyltransferase [Dehalococcoidia bacterium]|jgi:dTDP-4-amino-4,6-dideoxy-D-glucose acyltransferase
MYGEEKEIEKIKKQLKYCGKNVKIWPLVKIVFPENISIDDETMIDDFTFLSARGDGIKIGKFCHIGVGCVMHSNGIISIGDFVGIGATSTVFSGSDDYHGNGFPGLPIYGEKYRKMSGAPVILEKHAHIGVGTNILAGVTIGEGCSVGAGSVVTRDLPAWTICYGSPCKPIKDKPKEKQLRLEQEFLEEYYKNKK